MTTEQDILPQEPVAAVKHMIKLSEQLIDIMDKESMAMTTRDAVSFTAAQDEKEHVSLSYEKASAEFGRRIEEFRGIDAALVERLGKLQKQLKEKALDNSAAMDRLQG